MVDWLPVDPDEIRNSIERLDEAFLRGELSRAEFIRRKRSSIKAKWEAMTRVSANLSRALEMAKQHLRSPNSELAEKAKELKDLALQRRARCWISFFKMTMHYMFPTMRVKRHKS